MSKKPLVVYTITTGKNGENYWNKIGAAWINNDGSLNVTLFALPINGSLHIREQKEDTSFDPASFNRSSYQAQAQPQQRPQQPQQRPQAPQQRQPLPQQQSAPMTRTYSYDPNQDPNGPNETF